MAKVDANPRAGLEPHDSDIRLPTTMIEKLSLFAQLKRKPTLAKFPGAIVVRRYRKGEELFRQGEAGWTAFYILTLEDVLAMRQAQLEVAQRENERRFLQMEIERLQQERKLREGLPEDHPTLRAATVSMATLSKKYAGPQQTLTRMLNFKSRPFEKTTNKAGQSLYIPIGGPKTASYDVNTAELVEGDLFGEMSCLFRTPRSATVKAERDCYMLEFLRNIL